MKYVGGDIASEPGVVGSYFPFQHSFCRSIGGTPLSKLVLCGNRKVDFEKQHQNDVHPNSNEIIVHVMRILFA